MPQRSAASPAQILIAWALQRGTSVIPKSASPTRIAENLAAAEMNLAAEDMQALAALDRHERLVDGSFWCDGTPYTLANLWDDAS